MNRQQRRVADDHGAVAIIAAVFALVMFGIAALVVDLGQARSEKRQSGNAADAASLAAAEILAEGGNMAAAVSAAKTSALTNAGTSATDWVGCTDGNALPVNGEAGNGCITFDSATTPKTVQVRIPDRLVKANFGGAVGVNSVPVTGSARATIDQVSPCLVCVLGNYDGQNSDLVLTTTNGSIAIAGNADLNPQGNIDAGPGGHVYVGGSVPSQGTVSPPPPIQLDNVYDPLGAMKLPPAGAAALGSTSVPSAGVCTAGLTYRNLNNCTSFTSGVYVVTESTNLGNAPVSPGMLVYLACESGTTTRVSRACTSADAGTTISAQGNAQFKLNGLDVPGYGNFSVIFDRNNKGTYSDQGTADSFLKGGFYGMSATLQNGGNATLTLNGILVVGHITGNGNPAGIADIYNGSDYQASTQPYLLR